MRLADAKVKEKAEEEETGYFPNRRKEGTDRGRRERMSVTADGDSGGGSGGGGGGGGGIVRFTERTKYERTNALFVSLSLSSLFNISPLNFPTEAASIIKCHM